MTKLTLFYREGCHLCEVMLSDLMPYLEAPNVKLQRIDIDEHPEWLMPTMSLFRYCILMVSPFVNIA